VNERLLVFDCHEAWVYQLRALNRPMDVVVGLRGRHTQGWDQHMRPVPPRARLIRHENLPRKSTPYGCIITHNLTDLLDAKNIPGPRILILHETLDGTALEQALPVSTGEFRATVAQFVRLTGTHVVAVSKLKGHSWGFEEDIVTSSVDLGDYRPWEGNLARGLRVANHVGRRPRTLLWDFHQRAFDGLPVTLVGHNPGIEGAAGAARDWSDLQETFRRHRFYIHTADPLLEDGYNMATMEAMAAGLPVLGNRNPTSPIEHGVSGFLADDPAELRSYALRLLADPELAARLGKAARAVAERRFSAGRFKSDFTRSIETAQGQWAARQDAGQRSSGARFPEVHR
jgi:glycosyltransferase involved in cell wall biosynthesis